MAAKRRKSTVTPWCELRKHVDSYDGTVAWLYDCSDSKSYFCWEPVKKHFNVPSRDEPHRMRLHLSPTRREGYRSGRYCLWDTTGWMDHLLQAANFDLWDRVYWQPEYWLPDSDGSYGEEK